jgi:plasmid stability protein
MPVTLSIKSVPEPIVASIKERARRHHRSLQGELLAILEDTAIPREMTVEAASRRLRALGRTSGGQSTDWIRAERDARAGR